MTPWVQTEDLVDSHEVARLLGLAQRNSVTTYLHRYPDMPRPVLDFGRGRTRLWKRSDIETWARQTGRLKEEGDALTDDRSSLARFVHKTKEREKG